MIAKYWSHRHKRFLTVSEINLTLRSSSESANEIEILLSHREDNYDVSKGFDGDVVLCRDTGMKDRNGKSIFEHHYVKFQNGNLWPVEWDENIGSRRMGESSGWNLLREHLEVVEVAESIFENTQRYTEWCKSNDIPSTVH
jgi:hypothetical protein